MPPTRVSLVCEFSNAYFSGEFSSFPQPPFSDIIHGNSNFDLAIKDAHENHRQMTDGVSSSMNHKFTEKATSGALKLNSVFVH